MAVQDPAWAGRSRWSYAPSTIASSIAPCACPARSPYAEDAIKQLVKDAVQRGKVDVFVSVNAAGAEEATVSLNRPVLEGYLRAMRTMVADYGVQDDISAAALSALPDIFVVEKPEEDEKQNLADLTAVAAEAIAVYQTMRETEGAAMAADLSSRAETIRGLVGRVEERSPVTLVEYRTRLENKLREVLAGTTIDESRILTEAAIFADRIAVDEETVRLRSHLAQLDSLLAGGGHRPQARLPAAGAEPRGQHHRLGRATILSRPAPSWRSRRSWKDPRTDPEHRVSAMRLINIGFGNLVSSERLLTIVGPRP